MAIGSAGYRLKRPVGTRCWSAVHLSLSDSKSAKYRNFFNASLSSPALAQPSSTIHGPMVFPDPFAHIQRYRESCMDSQYADRYNFFSSSAIFRFIAGIFHEQSWNGLFSSLFIGVQRAECEKHLYRPFAPPLVNCHALFFYQTRARTFLL